MENRYKLMLLPTGGREDYFYMSIIATDFKIVKKVIIFYDGDDIVAMYPVKTTIIEEIQKS